MVQASVFLPSVLLQHQQQTIRPLATPTCRSSRYPITIDLLSRFLSPVWPNTRTLRRCPPRIRVSTSSLRVDFYGVRFNSLHLLSSLTSAAAPRRSLVPCQCNAGMEITMGLVAQCAAFTASDGRTPGFASPSRMTQARRGDEVVSSKCPVSAALRSWAIQRD